MRRLFPNSPVSRSRWPSLLVTMLLLSLGLHGVLLMIPIASSDEAEIPPPDLDQDTIAITRVPPATTEPAPPTASTPSPQGSPQSTPAADSPPAPAPRRSSPPARTPQRSNPRRSARSAEAEESEVSASATAAARAPAPTAPFDSPLPTYESVSVPQALRDRIERLAQSDTLALPRALLDHLLSLQEAYTFKADNVSDAAFYNSLETWVEQYQQDLDQSELWHQPFDQPLALSVHRRVCLEPDPNTATVGVLVRPDGKLQASPTLLRSSGYSALDQRVLKRVEGHDFPAPGDLNAYTVDVEVNLDYGPQPCLDKTPE